MNEKRQGRFRDIDIPKYLLPLAGLGAFIWFLVRVIPKPSRASYPCMRAAFPLASSFVVGLVSFVSSAVLFRKAREFLYRHSLALFAACLGAGLGLGAFSLIAGAEPAAAATAAPAAKLADDMPNMPMGEGKGIFPGRVVWVHDPDATNEKYANGGMKLWFDAANAVQEEVDSMMEKGILSLAGKDSVQSAWDALFKDFNKTHGRGEAGYAAGEKIVIKININGIGNGYQNINTSPQVLHALVSQLTGRAGVPQEAIIVGEPNIDMDKKMYKSLYADFPKLQYMRRGRMAATNENVLRASDGGNDDPLPRVYQEAAYMINVPVLKKHHRAGISLTAKLHFGSVTPYNGNGAFNWHYGLPAPDGAGRVSNGEYGSYRCLVDFMGHEDLGGKTILYLVDGLWSSINWGHPAIKWRMAPFNGDYPSSIFLSQDPVATDSVGYDFLVTEFDRDHPTEGRNDSGDNSGPFPQYAGVDDYLHQAASKAKWAAGVTYDPEGDGTPLGSLGVHEHWNNPTDKKYSRNLGTGKGIELLYVK
jgi:hypothetical protein